MKKPYFFTALLALSLLLAGLHSCRSNAGSAVSELDTLYAPKYAEGFLLLKTRKGSSVLVINNPWQGAADVRMEIFLSRGGEAPPDGFDGTVVDAPLKRVVCMSSTYVAFLSRLDKAGVIKGVSGGRYIYDPAIRERIESGDIKDVGSDTGINYELLAAIRPDLVFIYGVADESSIISGKSSELGIKTAYIADYLETDPLGKAEWIVAFGEMTGSRERAESIFGEICREYLAVKELAAGVEARPEVMLNSPWRDTWFVPGDQSYMVALINDAGGNYRCRGVDSRQSRPLSGESAYVMAKESDFWLNPGQYDTLSELMLGNPKFKNIPAVKKGKVYNNNLRSPPDGGSDFWESGAVQPDIVLKDLIRILHPGLLSGHELYYYHKLD